MLVKVDNSKFYEFLIKEIIDLETRKKVLEDKHIKAVANFQEGMETSFWFRFKHKFYYPLDLDARYLTATIQVVMRELNDLIEIERIFSYNIRSEFDSGFTEVDTKEHPVFNKYIQTS